MNRTAFKFAASTVIVAMTTAGFSAPGAAMRRLGDTVQANSRTDREAAQLHERAATALREGRLAEALSQMEEAVALSPRDIGYRLLLGDIYLKSGRFESARATFGDVLILDPGNVRAGLNSALTLVALGRPQAAGRQLDALASSAPPSDIGLAYALAGRTDRAITILEDAARRSTVTPRIRQNLALAYAISGDWRRARAVAAQDLPSSELGARLQQWAAFARPDSGPQQVAGLLGVTPGEDPGQPVRLALAPVADDNAVAFAEATQPAPAVSQASFAPVPAPAPEPVQVAEAAPAEAPAFWAPTAQAYVQPEADAPAPVAVAAAEPAPAIVPAVAQAAQQPALAEVAAVVNDVPEAPLPPAPLPAPVQAAYTPPAPSFDEPQAPLIRAEAGAARTPPPPFRRARHVEVNRGNQPVVVQLGAFSNEGNAERAWVSAERDYHLADYRPLTTTFDHEGRTLHRVSVSGFASTADAQRLCGAIKARGGVCFVRAQAGDAAIRWAARYADPRRRNV
ncbi:MAG TPA: tetratricopeptide repeat protein [Allosphingosinicella sp.]|nr:tetratricopeptide repeat protein [Allosphingosinicella sp.]